MNVKALRNKLNLTQQQLAVKLGVATFTIRRWEAEASKPSPLALRQLSRLDRKAGTSDEGKK